jgi:FkbM family methyltransferase
MMAEQVTLANGLQLWAPNAFEAQTLYREIFVDRQYAANDITLEPGAVIFDVGANVGMFSIAMMQRYPGARIHAFEPIPDLFEILSRNLTEHVPTAVRRNVGLGGRAGTARFAFDRYSTFSASAHPEVFKTRISLFDYAAASIDAAHRVTPSAVTARLLAGLDHPVTRPLVLAFMVPVLAGLELRKRLFLRECECELDTLSAALATSGEDAVDLVKIDVEGAEEEVLAGVNDSDWPRLRQLVVEVHDVDGRLDRMTRRLKQLGYAVRVEPNSWPVLRLLRISTLYAIRGRAEAA